MLFGICKVREHISLETDYAHSIANRKQAIDFMERLGLPKENTDNIPGGNAARICRKE
jgi:hypothetical protein